MLDLQRDAIVIVSNSNEMSDSTKGLNGISGAAGASVAVPQLTFEYSNSKSQDLFGTNLA